MKNSQRINPMTAEVTYYGHGRRTESFASPRSHIPPYDNNAHHFAYCTEAGGVRKYTFAIVNGKADQESALVEGVTINTREQTWHWPHRFVVLPGGIWSKTIFDGNRNTYWEARGENREVPNFFQLKLAQPPALPQVGPYSPWWSEAGNAKGGQGAEGNWFAARHCGSGWARAFDEAAFTAQRNPNAYLEDDGEPRYWSQQRFSLPAGHNVPEGFQADLSRAADFWPEVVQLAAFTKHDGQHGMRSWRAALQLRHADPFCFDLTRWNYNHVKLALYPDAARDSEPEYHWTVRQILHDIVTNPGPSRFLGREFAHAARLAWEVDPRGELATMMEECCRWAADPVTGVCYLTSNAPELNGAWGAYHPDSPWEVGDLAAQVFQWNILADAMKLRPGLADIVERFEAWCPPKTRWYGDGQGTFYGGVVPLQHLMRGELCGKSVQSYLDYAAQPSVGVDAGGSNPLNYAPYGLLVGRD